MSEENLYKILEMFPVYSDEFVYSDLEIAICKKVYNQRVECLVGNIIIDIGNLKRKEAIKIQNSDAQLFLELYSIKYDIFDVSVVALRNINAYQNKLKKFDSLKKANVFIDEVLEIIKKDESFSSLNSEIFYSV